MVKKIIKEAMEKNPLGLKEAVAEELRNRVALALEAKMEESVDLEEAKMTDAEVLSAAKTLAANGKDAKTKAFGKGLVDFYKKEGSFTPAQVGGLQNIMKNASFQMAKESVELEEAQTTYRVGGFYTHRGDDKPASIKISASSEAEAKQKAKDQLSVNHKNYRATTVKVL